MNCNKTEVTNNINNNYNCKNNKQNSGLMNYTYAEYVILSATLAYAIGEELNDADLTLFLVFLSQLSSDLSLIITKRGFEKNQSQQQAIVSETLTEEDIENVTSYELTRGRKRKVKKRKVKKKKTL
ncbi:hypothetical protein LZ906_005865 [Paraclostridium ghonii]|uniref:hypothetical protein n=1 Tax=Paraclostridium ghonii TaxID=29358 RepID=UPI00202CD2E8|nr:hypothetical protein [Paeniclostridium ghonii]MCM0165356.1 hypothetical protein [Paeniclostridium ghonii]